jgi:hypothetical protein
MARRCRAALVRTHARAGAHTAAQKSAPSASRATMHWCLADLPATVAVTVLVLAVAAGCGAVAWRCQVRAARAHRGAAARAGTARAAAPPAAAAAAAAAAPLLSDDASVGSMRHITWLLRMDTLPEIWALGLWKDAKEVTESVGTVRAAFPFVSPTDARVVCVVAGDGTRARTGAFAAFSTSWTVASVDPELRAEWTGPSPMGVQRLHGARLPLRDWVMPRDWAPEGTTLLLLLPHAHVTDDEAAGWVAANVPPRCRTVAVHLPCCGKCAWSDATWRELQRFEDGAIASPKRLVRVLEPVVGGGAGGAGAADVRARA